LNEIHIEKCRAGLWGKRVEQVAKSSNISEKKGEARDLCCETCSEINMFENKALSPITAFLFKNLCMLLHEFKHPLQRCIFFPQCYYQNWVMRILIHKSI